MFISSVECLCVHFIAAYCLPHEVTLVHTLCRYCVVVQDFQACHQFFSPSRFGWGSTKEVEIRVGNVVLFPCKPLSVRPTPLNTAYYTKPAFMCTARLTEHGECIHFRQAPPTWPALLCSQSELKAVS